MWHGPEPTVHRRSFRCRDDSMESNCYLIIVIIEYGPSVQMGRVRGREAMFNLSQGLVVSLPSLSLRGN